MIIDRCVTMFLVGTDQNFDCVSTDSWTELDSRLRCQSKIDFSLEMGVLGVMAGAQSVSFTAASTNWRSKKYLWQCCCKVLREPADDPPRSGGSRFKQIPSNSSERRLSRTSAKHGFSQARLCLLGLMFFQPPHCLLFMSFAFCWRCTAAATSNLTISVKRRAEQHHTALITR